ncbi:MAG: 5'-deoxynucleotidase [Parasporobacterium sp.]|nr:5'-deoxynucleotidase [Parasporobacterium sp.]
MNNSNFYAMLSRMKYVNRWGLMRNTIQESLSDHTMDVVIIAHALVVIGNTYFGKKLDESRAALLAAFHDAPEIITGDMPTPVKYYSQDVKEAYAKVEEAAVCKMLDSLPEELRSHYEGLMNCTGEEDAELHRYVKAADKISALIKCIEEERMGNMDFTAAKDATLKIIESMDMPEVRMFMEYFTPGYYMTLDEQQKND